MPPFVISPPKKYTVGEGLDPPLTFDDREVNKTHSVMECHPKTGKEADGSLRMIGSDVQIFGA